MLEDDGVAGVEAGEDFGAGSVGDTGFDGYGAAAFFLLGCGHFDGGVAVLVVDDCLFRYGKDVFVLFENDLSVGGHVGFEFSAGVVDGDADLKGGDVVFFYAKRGDAGDFAEEGFIFERLDLDAGGLAEIDLANVGLVDLALNVDLADVADGHDEGCSRAEDENGGDCVAFFHVAGEDDSVHGRGDGGVGELLFELLERGFGLCDLRFGLMELGGIDGDLGDGFIAGVYGEEVLLLSVVEGLVGDDPVLGHLQGAGVGVLVHGQVWSFCVDLVVLNGSGGGVGVGLSSGELSLLRSDLSEDLHLIELGEELSCFYVVVDVGVEIGDDSGGLGFDLNLGDGLDFACGNDGAGDIAELSLRELGWLQLGAAPAGGDGDAEDCGDDQNDEAAPDPEFTFALTRCSQGVTPGVLMCACCTVPKSGYAESVRAVP